MAQENCPNCGVQISENDLRICHEHGNHYCEWCAEDSKGSCQGVHYSPKQCRIAVDNGIPFILEKEK